MRRMFHALLFPAVFVGSAFVMACGANITQKELDEPCTRTAQCDTGLVCLTGVCQLDPNDGTAGAGGSP